MTLLRVGHRILNLDNVTSVNLTYPAGPTETCVRVFFVGGTNAELSRTDFRGAEAEMLRAYFEGVAIDAAPYVEYRDRCQNP